MAENKGRKILVAVDEGEESAYALSWCLNNFISPRNSKDTLILLFAKKPLAVYSAMDSTGNFSPISPSLYIHCFFMNTVQKSNYLILCVDLPGYIFSSSIIASMERYGNEVAERVMDKATRICKEFSDEVIN